MKRQPSRPGKTSRKIFIILFATVICVLPLCGWLWLDMGKISSVRAMMAGTLYMVTPDSPGLLAAVYVKEGQSVSAGQPVAAMNDLNKQLEMPGAFAHGEKRLNAHDEEQRKKRQYEEKTVKYAQAQLHLRALDIQGGAAVVGRGRYEEAVRNEAEAKAQVQAARREYEQASLARARGRRLVATQGGGAMAQGQYNESLGLVVIPVSVQQDGVLFSPADGHVLRCDATPGHALLRGDSILLIQPAAENSSSSWIYAYFPLTAAKRIQPGQPCAIWSSAFKGHIMGKVEEVFPAQSIPGSTKRGIPVSIRPDVRLSASLTPGYPVSCELRVHDLLGFRGF